jgi:hypothetical protein
MQKSITRRSSRWLEFFPIRIEATLDAGRSANGVEGGNISRTIENLNGKASQTGGNYRFVIGP